MKALKATIITIFITAGLFFLGGCQEGGRFLGQIEDSLNKEGDKGEEMAWHFRNYYNEEKARPLEMRKNWQNAYHNNEVQRERLSRDIRNYLKREREVYPNLNLSVEQSKYSEESGKTHRTFPGDSE